jgi:hypothetical protein
MQIDEQIDKGAGGLVMDAAKGLKDHVIHRLAEKGWPTDIVVVVDFFFPYGYPVLDFLQDDSDDNLSPFEVVEEVVSATALLSNLRSTPGARELDLSRMCFLPLVLAGKPLSHIGLFTMDSAYRDTVVKATGHPDLERFWCGKDSYFSRLGKDVLESIRNKWNPLVIHPAIKKVINEKGSSFSLYEFMQNGGWVIVDLSEDRLKFELRQTIAQLIQCWLKVNTLKRQRVKERPLFMCWLDEYPQYRAATTHTDLLRISRQLGLGIVFLCQDLGIFSNDEYRAITGGCATLMALNCSQDDASDMARQLFLHDGSLWRDWESTRNYSSQDELNAYISLIMQLEPGQAICRVKPSKDSYLLDIPEVHPPKVSEKTVQHFLRDIHYRTLFAV